MREAQWLRFWPKRVGVDTSVHDAQFAGVHACRSKGLPVELARHPNFIQRVTTLGPSIGNTVGLKHGPAYAQMAIDFHVPKVGHGVLVQNASRQLNPLPRKALQTLPGRAR